MEKQRYNDDSVINAYYYLCIRNCLMIADDLLAGSPSAQFVVFKSL